ncbi:hypothetical protein [Virgibacillus halodenitrificans]|uniref:hypothetical protein n=1 Tax=Virgibacillus halodenitrificans TaxID=1482 RepID=UPI000EF44293|nr:hypothetical protein [Virgibacillus halodenitrificans]
MDRKNKIIVSTVAATSVIAVAGVGIGFSMDITDDVNTTEKESKSEIEKEKYNEIIELANNVGVPTLFDGEKGSPFQTVYVTNGPTDNIYMEFMIFSKSGKEMRYVINTNGDRFNTIKKNENFKEKALEDGLKVLTDGTTYYWQDKENKAYLSIDSLNPKITKGEDIEEIIQSIGESTFDIISKIDYGFENINVPSYTIGKSKTMDLVMDYQSESIKATGKDNRIVNLIYKDVEIGQSKTFDFTQNLSKEEKEESIEVSGENAYIYTNKDSNIVRVFYKNGETSYVLQISVMTENDQLLEDPEYAKEELLKVLKSMSFE